MKTSCLLLYLTLAVGAVANEPDPIREWKPGAPGLTVGSGTSYDEASTTFLVKSTGQAVVPVITDTQPQRTLQRYSVVGEVKYEKVGGTGYLELWNVFPPVKPGMSQGHYFSRTRDTSGPMGALHGDHDWREFILPFNPAGAVGAPLKLEFNVSLPEGGTVWLRNLRLTPLPEVTPMNHSALVGTVGGTLLALMAFVVALCMRAGRGLVLAKAAIMVVQAIGLVGLLGAAAAGWWKDWEVAGCLLLLACIALLNVRMLRRQVVKGIAERERRRMSAIDA